MVFIICPDSRVSEAEGTDDNPDCTDGTTAGKVPGVPDSVLRCEYNRLFVGVVIHAHDLSYPVIMVFRSSKHHDHHVI